MDRGEIMLHTVTQDMALYKNRHHFSKETLANLHTSEIVPLGSPLSVGFMLIVRIFPTLMCLLFTGHFPFNCTLVAGLWHLQKDSRTLFECRASHPTPKSER